MIFRSSFFTSTLVLATALLTLAPVCAETNALTPDQIARFQKFLPHAYAKLSQGEPLMALAIGDSVMDMKVYDENAGNVLKSYAGVFLQELADQFYYTAGVRLKNPNKGQPARLSDSVGKEITLVNAASDGKLAIHAAQALPLLLSQKKPDMALISFGLDDALAKLSLTAYRRGLQEAVDLLKAENVDVLLIGPTITVSDPPEQGLALTQPYADVMREVAVQSGVFFCDMGSLAGLVKLDERYKELVRPVKKPEPLDEEAAKAKAALPPSPVKVPIPDELDADEEKHAAGFFSQLLVQCRPYFEHGGNADTIHPNTAFHRLLGRRIFTELLNGPKATPWKMGRAVADLEGNGKCSVTFRIDNESKENALKVYPLPMLTPSWKPLDVPAQIEIKPDKHGDITVGYQQTNKEDTHAFDQSILRLPVLLISNGEARIETLQANVTPLSVLWLTGTKFNQSELAIDAQIANATKEPLTGKWEAAWLGQKLTGTFSAAANAGFPVALKFKLPAATRQKGVLNLTVTTNGKALRFDRELEVVQNIGLKQVVPLLLESDYIRDKAIPATTDANVTFRADADEKAFYLTWDIHGINLQESPDGNMALKAEIHLDARSYGKRLMPGVTDSILLASGAADGDGRANPLEPWTFGSGYNGKYDRNGLQSLLSSRGDGSRRFTVLIPRQYFNLHEWAMGNGNSELGINTSLNIWQPDTANAKGSYTKYVLITNGLHPDDAESLAVLELNDPHTSRWTVRLY